jgi:hypothetical protein
MHGVQKIHAVALVRQAFFQTMRHFAHPRISVGLCGKGRFGCGLIRDALLQYRTHTGG